MRLFARTTILCVCLFVAFYQPTVAKSRAVPVAIDPISIISADFSSGKISLDEKAELIVRSIKNPTSLPAKYLGSIDSKSNIVRFGGRSATPALLEIVNSWDELSPKTQLAFSQAMTRPVTDFTYDSPGGFFKLHYNDTGTHAVPVVDDNFNFIPDYIEQCASYMDSSYDPHVLLGYIDPPSDGSIGGDSKYDVYFENMGFYGYMQPESPGPETWNDFISYIVLNNNFVGFPPNDDPEGNVAGAAKATAAHEFHHSVQVAYRVNMPSWWLESDATHMEDIIFEAVNDNYNYLPTFTNSPQVSLLENSGHAYSCFIWQMFLVEHFDDDIIVAITEGTKFETLWNSLTDTLMGRYGWTVDSAFHEFANWNYTTNSHDDGLHYSDGADYPLVDVARSHSIYPVNLQSSPTSPAGYATTYLSFFPGIAEGTLNLTFNGADNVEWNVWIDKSTADNSHEFEQIVINGADESGAISIENFQSYFRVALIACNVTVGGPTSTFSYSASVVTPRGVNSSVVTLDSAIYSGGDRSFQVNVQNSGAATDIIGMLAWSELGWVALDSLFESLAPLEDTIFSVLVEVPQGTALGSTSEIYTKAWSWADTSVFVIDTFYATTELLHGDVNFSGAIDISDVTSIVDYFFRSGPAPVPVLEAADFTCSVDVSISDLTGLVDYLFRGGSYPPCNPY